MFLLKKTIELRVDFSLKHRFPDAYAIRAHNKNKSSYFFFSLFYILLGTSEEFLSLIRETKEFLRS